MLQYCPSCGQSIPDAEMTSCPTCGLSLATESVPAPTPPLTSVGDAIAPAEATSTTLNEPHEVSQPPTALLSPQPSPAAQNAAPVVPSSYPSFPTAPYPTPAYPNPQNPSMPLSYPSYPSYPYPAPGMPSVPFPQGPFYGAPFPTPSQFQPQQPSRSRISALTIVALVLVLILVAATSFGLGVLVGSHTTSSNSTSTSATATPTPTGPSLSSIIYQNTFVTSAVGWTSDTNCYWKAGAYHVNNAVCFAPAGAQTDVDVSVQVRRLSGGTSEQTGISVRHAGIDKRYDFNIYGDSTWAIFRCDGKSSDGSLKCHRLTSFTTNTAIHGGLNTTNTLDVRAKGSHFDFFVNGTQVGSIDDATYAAGAIGLGAGNVDCAFTNLTISTPD